MAAPAIANHLADRSLPDLVKRLTTEGTHLARSELQLATADLKETAEQAKATGKLVGVASVLSIIAVAALTTAAVLALALVLPGWLAGLALGVPVAIIALILALRARTKIKQLASVPERTLQSLRADLDWISHQLAAPGRYQEPAPETKSGSIRAQMGHTVTALVHQADPRVQLSIRLRRVTDQLKLAVTSLLKIIRMLRGGNGR